MKLIRALALSLLVCSCAIAQQPLPQNAALMPMGKQTFLDANGNPLAGGLVWSYAAGTSTLQATYTDSTAATANPNPVVLDSAGRAAIWLKANQSYKIVTQNYAGVSQWTADNVNEPSLYYAAQLQTYISTLGTATLVSYTAPGTGAVSRTISARLADRVDASDYSGSDAGAQLANAIAAVSTGGVVDATMLSGTLAAAATLTINKPVILKFGNASITFAGNPGISVTSKGVTLQGLGHVVSGQTAGVGPSVLVSGGAFPLIQNVTGGADGMTIRDLEINCNALGTYGVYVPRTGPSTVTMDGLNVHGCATSGITTLGGLNDLKRSYIWGNGGEGVQFGSDGSIDQYTEVATNTGVGIHVLYGGSRIRAMADFNGSYGIYIDGRANSNSANDISDCYVDDNGTDNIRIEGQSTGNRNAQYNQVNHCYLAQAAVTGVPADAIRVLNASGTVLSGNTFLGSGLSSASVTDTGGVLIQNSDNTQLNGFDASFAIANAVSLVGAGDTRILGLHARDTAISTTSTAASYALSIDAASARTYVFGSDSTDDRGTTYARGVNNLGSGTLLLGWGDFTGVASPDVYGSAALYSVNPSGGITLTPTSGQYVTLGGTASFGTAAGSTVTEVQGLTGTTCTTAAAAGAQCVGTTQSFAAAFADANYRISCTLLSPTTGIPSINAINKTASGFTMAISAGTAVAASAGYDCEAVHN